MKQETEQAFNDYLGQIERYLKRLPAMERADIVKEIKSEMVELAMQKGLSAEEVTERLGKPKELAAAYLGEAIGKSSRFSLQRLGTVFLFYSLAGMGSLFFLPFTSILSVMLMVFGILAPVAGAIKALGFFVGIEVPWVMFQIGSGSLHPLLVFPASAVMGLMLFAGGRGLWKLNIRYIRLLGQKKRSLEES